jgi:hypothetical protein
MFIPIQLSKCIEFTSHGMLFKVHTFVIEPKTVLRNIWKGRYQLTGIGRISQNGRFPRPRVNEVREGPDITLVKSLGTNSVKPARSYFLSLDFLKISTTHCQ